MRWCRPRLDEIGSRRDVDVDARARDMDCARGLCSQQEARRSGPGEWRGVDTRRAARCSSAGDDKMAVGRAEAERRCESGARIDRCDPASYRN